MFVAEAAHIYAHILVLLNWKFNQFLVIVRVRSKITFIISTNLTVTKSSDRITHTILKFEFFKQFRVFHKKFPYESKIDEMIKNEIKIESCLTQKFLLKHSISNIIWYKTSKFQTKPSNTKAAN